MALIICPECGKEVSDKADVCIHCGYPLHKYIEEEKKLETLTVSEGNASIATPIVAFVICEIIITGIMIGAIFTYNFPIIIGAAIYCGVCEILGVVGMITDIVKRSKLNRTKGRGIGLDASNKKLYFKDIDNRDHVVDVNDIVQFDGPGTLVITYLNNNKRREKATVGLTNRNEVLRIREVIKNLKSTEIEQKDSE